MHLDMTNEKEELERVRVKKQRELKKKQRDDMNRYQTELHDY